MNLVTVPAPKPTDSESEIALYTARIEELRNAYERYFSGVDRSAPIREHDALTRQTRKLIRVATKSTVFRFKLQAMRQRFSTYEQYWGRIMRAIENGTHKRVVAESERRGRAKILRDAPADAPVAARREDTVEASCKIFGMEAAEANALYTNYVAARKSVGMSVEGITCAGLAKKLSMQLPALERKHGVAVRFEVSTEGGKVKLRARKRSV